MANQIGWRPLIQAYVRAYNTEREKIAATANTARVRLESRLANLAAERRRVVDLIVGGVVDEEDGRDRLLP